MMLHCTLTSYSGAWRRVFVAFFAISLLALPTAMRADDADQYFWRADDDTPTNGSATLVSNELLSLNTVYYTKLGYSAQTIMGESFTHYIQVRVAADPTAETPTGTEQENSTPLVLTAMKDVSVTFFYRRQASTGYVINDGKDLKMLDQTDLSTPIGGTFDYEEIEGQTYAFAQKTCILEAGHTYTVFCRGTTIQLYGVKIQQYVPWTGITIDYEDEVVDWATATGGRFTPVIMQDGDNHYLSVDQNTRYNNGTTLTSQSLQNVVPDGEDFTLQFDLKLGNANGGTPRFAVYDQTENGVLFSLTATAANVDTWAVNGTRTTVTLPNSGDVRYKTIADITWCSIKVVRSGKLTFLSIVNKATGEEIYPLWLLSGASKQGGLGRMEFVTTRNFANFAIDNVVVRPVQNGDVPDLPPTTCTVHFVDEQGNAVKDDEVVSTVAGIEYDGEDNLKADFYSADGTAKYLFVQAETITTVEDGTQNELTLTFRQAETWTYTVNAVDGSGNVLKSIATGQKFENDKFLVPYSRFISASNQLWSTAAQQSGDLRGQFRVLVSMTQDNTVVNQVYDAYDASGALPVFVAEAEDLPGLTLCTNGNMTIRSSNAACAYATERTTLTTLPSGAYTVIAGSSVPGSQRTLTIYLTNDQEETVLDMTAKNTNLFQNETSVWSDRPVTVSFEGGHADSGLDYIVILKTADVEDVTTPLDIDADELALLRTAYNDMTATEEWSRKWNLGSDAPRKNDLPGVTIEGTHITAINLSDNNLTGSFPFSLLQLPRMETLSLQSNRLSGDLGTEMKAYAEQSPIASQALKALYIDNNAFTGNIGLFASCLPLLQTLHAGNNQFTEVQPVISANVTDLYLDYQTIDQQVTLHPGKLSEEELAQLPNILLYNHAQQGFNDYIGRVWLSLEDYSWQATCGITDGSFYVWQATETDPYHGQSGDVVRAVTDAHHTLPARLTFLMGDANFDGSVSVLDVQADVNHIVGDWSYYSPFNFTAADLKTDETVNVLDVVKLVDLIMSNTAEDAGNDDASGSRRLAPASEEQAEATVSVADGQLTVSSTVPVAAFDIVVSGATSFTLSAQLRQAGFTCRWEQQQGGVRIIAYSLSGATLPAGTTTLGRVPQGVPTRMTLSDNRAHAIKATAEGGITTAIGSTATDGTPAAAAYRFSIGHDRAVVIDAQGKKTIEKKTTTTK